jgi:transcriptional regulator with XRE-family HTH domain
MVMLVGERLKQIRESKNFSQGDIEEKTGLLRCYTSRVENGHTVPSLETLQKFARALEIPLYQLFYDGPDPEKVKGVRILNDKMTDRDRREVENLGRLFVKLNKRDKALVRAMVLKLTKTALKSKAR